MCDFLWRITCASTQVKLIFFHEDLLFVLCVVVVARGWICCWSDSSSVDLLFTSFEISFCYNTKCFISFSLCFLFGILLLWKTFNWKFIFIRSEMLLARICCLFEVLLIQMDARHSNSISITTDISYIVNMM